MKTFVTGTLAALALVAGSLTAVATARLEIGRAVFVTTKVEKFGQFEQHRNVFAPGEDARLYVEPIGFVHVNEDGSSRVDLTGGIKVSAPEGSIVLEKANLVALRASSREKENVYLNFSVHLPKSAQPGTYVVSLNLIDNLSGRTADRSLPLVIEPRTKCLATSDIGEHYTSAIVSALIRSQAMLGCFYPSHSVCGYVDGMAVERGTPASFG